MGCSGRSRFFRRLSGTAERRLAGAARAADRATRVTSADFLMLGNYIAFFEASRHGAAVCAFRITSPN